MLKRAAQTDKAEADEPELDIPAELALRQERLEVIKAALEGASAQADTRRGRKPEGKDADGDDGDGGDGGASDIPAAQKARPRLQARVWRA